MSSKKNITLFFLIFILISGSTSNAGEYNTDPRAYILSKFKTHDLVFLGEIHKRPPIINFISGLIPELHGVGVTQICLEIPSDQQDKIDHFIRAGEGLSRIEVSPQIDCPEYRQLFVTMRNLPSGENINPVAIDLPYSKFKEDISRNEYMAQAITELYKKNPGKKTLVVLGNLHVLKKLDLEEHVISKYKAIGEYLSKMFPGIRMFFIGQVIDSNSKECDFTKTFAPIDGIVAFDCTKKFAGWKLGILSLIAIKETEPYDAFDGLIVY